MERLNPRIYLDLDPAMTAASDQRVPSQKAILDLVSGNNTGGGGGGHSWGGGIDTTNDIIIDSTTSGLVLKSADLDYWRITINNAGTLVITNLGPTKP